MLGENWLIFALDPNLELDAETLVFHSGPKFLCFLVDFYKYFWFWCQTEIVSEKVYAVIWPVLEISSLNIILIRHVDLSMQGSMMSIDAGPVEASKNWLCR